MNGIELGKAEIGPLVDVGERRGSVGVLLAFAFLLVAAAILFATMTREEAEPYVLLLLGVLAMLGVFFVFAGAIGLVRFGAGESGAALGTAFLDSMAEGVLVTDPQGRIVYANRSYGELIGARSPAELRTVERLFSGDAAAAEKIYGLARAAASGRRAEEEIRTPHPLTDATGPPRWYRIRTRPLIVFGGAGGRERRLVTWRVADITHERDAQETNFQALQQLVTYLDHAPAGFFSADPAGRIVYINATLAEWLGYDLARFETGAITVADIVQGAGAALLNERPQPGDLRPRVVDVDLRKRDGQSLPVRLLHRVPTNPDGTPGDSRTLVLNRSPGEDGAEALRAAEVRFARFFNSTPLAIASIDASGRVVRANATFARLFGARRIGSEDRLIDAFAGRDAERLGQALDAAVAGKADIAPVDVALAVQDNAKRRSMQIYVSAIAGGAADEERAVLYALDTTEQRELEGHLAQAEKLKSIGELAGGIAHDINNLLTPILGCSDFLLSNHAPTDPGFDDIIQIKQNTIRAANLVRQLLAFSRRQTLQPEVLALADVLADVQRLLKRAVGDRIELSVANGRDLWPVMADQSEFVRVIMNLAVNARDAMPDGGKLALRTANVSMSEAPDTPGMPAGDYVLIEVSDTGKGMSPEVLERIFEPFFTTKPVGQGTGLGLSTVYGIVKQTGGYIFCDSAVGRGTTFRIYLPRHIEAALPAEPVKEESAPPAAAANDLTGSASVLLVEDEEAVRAIAKRVLVSRGYSVHEATTGHEALQVMRRLQGRIDLVVSDVVMPEMDGPTLLKELRKQKPDLKIIFISGYAEDAFAKNLPGKEKFHFLPKPFSLKQLAEAVKETLGSR